MARIDASRGEKPQAGDDVLEIHVADDRLRVAGTFGDGKPRVHIVMGGDQALGQRRFPTSTC